MKRTRTKSFLDTNVFIYTFDPTAPRKRERAREIVVAAVEGRDGVISYQVVQEFLNVATRKFTPAMPQSAAQVYLTRILMPLCEIYPDLSLYSRALRISAEAGISFYDALIVGAAAAAECNVLLSEDLQHGRRIGDVEIRNPFL